jgi:hypothetical protein
MVKLYGFLVVLLLPAGPVKMFGTGSNWALQSKEVDMGKLKGLLANE